MDYLRFVLTAVLVIAVLLVEINIFGPGTGTLTCLSVSVVLVHQFRPSHTIAIILWLSAVFSSSLFMRPLIHQYVLDHPGRYKEGVEGIVAGILFLAAAVIFHPICYGVGRLVTNLWKRARLARQGGIS
jgi:hypothetical protein